MLHNLVFLLNDSAQNRRIALYLKKESTRRLKMDTIPLLYQSIYIYWILYYNRKHKTIRHGVGSERRKENPE